jgi:polyhydroxyalkanoate synthesis regulator protein
MILCGAKQMSQEESLELKEDKEKQGNDLSVKEDELDEQAGLLSMIAEHVGKNLNIELFREYVQNYFEFSETFDRMTSDPENFMSLTQLEEQMSVMVKKSKKMVSELATDKLCNIQDGGIIQKKKTNTSRKA